MLIFNALFPVVAIAALGYWSRTRHWLNELEVAVIERLSFWFLIPCLLFHGAATADFPSQLPWAYLAAFYAVIGAMYGVCMLWARWRYHYDLRHLSVVGMTGAYANATVLGIPIAVGILGQAALVPMLMIICVHNLVIFSVGTVLAEWQAADSTQAQTPTKRASLRGVLVKLKQVVFELGLNPISGSLLAGAALNWLGVQLPSPLLATLDLLGGAAIPGSVFALGAALVRYKLRDALWPAVPLVVMKLLLLPALMWCLMLQLSVDLLWRQAATLIAAMPVGISVYVFSRRYQCCEEITASAIVLSTVLSIVTLTLWGLWVVE